MQRVAFFLHKRLKCTYKGLLGELKIDENLNFITETEIIQILAIAPPPKKSISTLPYIPGKISQDLLRYKGITRTLTCLDLNISLGTLSNCCLLQ